MSFETRVHGKWILAGEHAVLRGAPALVFPLYSRSLDLSFLPTNQPQTDSEIHLNLSGEHGEELQLCFWGVLEKACALKKVRRSTLAGLVKIHSTIPVGAGLGASAALCVAMARWFQALGILQESELQDFSRQLENLFHGESSGVDVAVALSKKPLRYARDLAFDHGFRKDRKGTSFFAPTWTPQWYVSYSGKRGTTMDCIARVKNLASREPGLAEQIDRDMAQAVDQAEGALQSSAAKGMPELKSAIDMAASCFQRWGLTDSAVDQHMKWLVENGALAVKPTGSGGGGFVLSLWDRTPTADVQGKLIPCY